jgi:ABC-2 type transport system permease protein
MINLTLLFIQLIFLAIGIFISVILPKIKSVLPISLGIVFALYLIGAIIVTGSNDWTRFISPFKYFDIPYIITNSSYEAPYLIIGAVIVITTIVTSYIIYAKKDIHAVS